MDERLATLAVYGGSDNDARRTAALMIRMVMKDGVLRQLTPWDLEDSIDNVIVYLARFMHQSVAELERREMSQLHRWYAIVIDIVRAQNGQGLAEE